ncbi:unnamed protein product [Bursaphelenchus okinawaensis]|uniref:G_PROTEIN_RECEP_F1_2 domain-containing protein n=1 Tax=Bursaphelenchus okinawaensis TaxID=465554 RepID=A0A811K4K3_9BILA|nr:unnamed protein product [Bursaphelenchus okinawaensis]CAG9091299.1 unnamed protein product [Bursaphelenchus okinawaensis]
MQLHFVPIPDNPYAWDYTDPNGTIPTQPYDELGKMSELLRISYHLSGACGFIFSSTMLYLVLFKTTGALKPYGRMLLFCSITDITYWAMDNLVQVKAKLTDGVFMARLEGPASYFEYDNQAKAMALFVCALALIHTILPAQYYFRYYAVTKSQQLSGIRTVIVYFLALSFAILMGWCAYVGYSISATVRPEYNYGVLWYREVPLPKVLYADIRNIYHKLYFFYSGALVTSCYVLLLLYAYKTLNHLKINSKMYSERTKSMQRQLSRALLIQSVLPIFTSIAPILFICVPSFFYLDTGKLAMVCISITSWIPVFNPLLTITVIKPYRRAITTLLARKSVNPSNTRDDPSNNNDHNNVVL